jgi:hypothetical protein
MLNVGAHAEMKHWTLNIAHWRACPVCPRASVSGYHSVFPTLMKPTDPVATSTIDNTPPNVPVPDYRPVERFWPYVDLPEQPTDEELAALNPELSEALFGTPKLPFSVSIDFPRFDGPDYARALEFARASAEYREFGSDATIRHRARFYPDDAVKLRDLFELVGRFDATEVLIDDRPVPYARELWLPLIWFLIR